MDAILKRKRGQLNSVLSKRKRNRLRKAGAADIAIAADNTNHSTAVQQRKRTKRTGAGAGRQAPHEAPSAEVQPQEDDQFWIENDLDGNASDNPYMDEKEALDDELFGGDYDDESKAKRSDGDDDDEPVEAVVKKTSKPRPKFTIDDMINNGLPVIKEHFPKIKLSYKKGYEVTNQCLLKQCKIITGFVSSRQTSTS